VELALGDEHGIEELLDPRILGFRVREDLTDEVHRLLDLEDVAHFLCSTTRVALIV
jgi:hypothetical protein